MNLFTALGVVFIVLKLIGVIEWSWWLVLLPIWGPFLAALVLLVMALIAEQILS